MDLAEVLSIFTGSPRLFSAQTAVIGRRVSLMHHHLPRHSKTLVQDAVVPAAWHCGVRVISIDAMRKAFAWSCNRHAPDPHGACTSCPCPCDRIQSKYARGKASDKAVVRKEISKHDAYKEHDKTSIGHSAAADDLSTPPTHSYSHSPPPQINAGHHGLSTTTHGPDHERPRFLEILGHHELCKWSLVLT